MTGQSKSRRHTSGFFILRRQYADDRPASVDIGNRHIIFPVTDVRNSVTEAKETLRAEIATLRAEMAKNHLEVMAAIKALDAKIDNVMRHHVLEYHK